jgi:hypothetical protein
VAALPEWAEWIIDPELDEEFLSRLRRCWSLTNNKSQLIKNTDPVANTELGEVCSGIFFVTGICSLIIILASHSCTVEILLSCGFTNGKLQLFQSSQTLEELFTNRDNIF